MAYIGLLLAVLVDNAIRLLVPEGFLLNAAPSLPLITALYIGFRARDTRPLGLAIVLGLLADCYSGVPLGHFAFLYGSAAYLALRTRRFVPPEQYTSHVVACFVAAAVTCFLGLAVAAATVDGRLLPGFLHSLLRALSSALFAPFVFGVWDKSRFFRRYLRPERYEFA